MINVSIRWLCLSNYDYYPSWTISSLKWGRIHVDIRNHAAIKYQFKVLWLCPGVVIPCITALHTQGPQCLDYRVETYNPMYPTLLFLSVVPVGVCIHKALGRVFVYMQQLTFIFLCCLCAGEVSLIRQCDGVFHFAVNTAHKWL